MNPKKTDGQEGTGTIGGWEKSEMRSYMIETIEPLIPLAIRNAIKSVYKNSKMYDINNTSKIGTTQDRVWIPSSYEIFTSGRTYEPGYKAVFYDANSRKKYLRTLERYWWLRDACNAWSFERVADSGGESSQPASVTHYIPLGFCT